jgi:hypothetical protein
MRRIFVHGFAAAAALALVAAPASAQQGVTFGVGGGLSIPLSDFADEDVLGAETGFQGVGFVGFQGGASLPVGFRIDGMFQRFSRNADAIGPGDFDVNYQLISGSANVVYEFATSDETRFRPYLIGGGGVYNVDLGGEDADLFDTEGQTKFGVNAGAGFNFAFGNVGLFLEGRFHNVFDAFGGGEADGTNLNFIPITLGLRFGGEGPRDY